MNDDVKPKHSSLSTDLSMYFCPICNICYLKKKKLKILKMCSLHHFKFLSPVWTSQFNLSESVIGIDLKLTKNIDCKGLLILSFVLSNL